MIESVNSLISNVSQYIRVKFSSNSKHNTKQNESQKAYSEKRTTTVHIHSATVFIYFYSKNSQFYIRYNNDTREHNQIICADLSCSSASASARHGMANASLQIVYRATITPSWHTLRLRWWGFITEADRQRLEAIIRRGKRTDLCSQDHPALAALVECADDLIKYWSTLDMSCTVFFLEKQFLPMHSGTDNITEN